MLRPRTIRMILKISLVLALLALAGTGCASTEAVPTNVPADPPAATITLHGNPGDPGQTLDGIPVGFTQEGYPYRGAADAPVTLIEYTDYLCPFCARHAIQTMPTLLERHVRSGQLRWVFRDFPLAGLHPTAAQGHAAAQCAGEQGAALFWQMNEHLFANQAQWSQLADPGAYLAQAARDLGADMAAYNACLDAGRGQAIVAKGIADAGALGFDGTPSFQLQGQGGAAYTLVGAQPVDLFIQWIDALLAGQVPPGAAAEPQKPAFPFWARPEGLAPDPDRPGLTRAGDPYKGNPEAALVVVEFGDFQCPSCTRHALQTQPTLDRAFVDSGQVFWVFKHLPLAEHPQALAAAVAAECAAEQGMFWEMYQALFANTEGWAVDDPDPALIALAEQIGLDAAFTACLQGRAALERVMADINDAQGVTTVTPTFIFLYGGQGTLMRGTHPPEQFTNILQTLLDQAKAGP